MNDFFYDFLYRMTFFVFGWCGATVFCSLVFARGMRKMFRAGLRLGHDRALRGEPADTPPGPGPGQRPRW